MRTNYVRAVIPRCATDGPGRASTMALIYDCSRGPRHNARECTWVYVCVRAAAVVRSVYEEIDTIVDGQCAVVVVVTGIVVDGESSYGDFVI